MEELGTELTPEVTNVIGKISCDVVARTGRYCSGHGDMRPDSATLASSLIEGLLEQGRDVINIG